MSIRLIIDGNTVYEIDEDCEDCRRKAQAGRGMIQKKEDPEKKRKAGKDETGG